MKYKHYRTFILKIMRIVFLQKAIKIFLLEVPFREKCIYS